MKQKNGTADSAPKESSDRKVTNRQSPVNGPGKTQIDFGDGDEQVEPPLYVSPPLELLPSQLQEFVHAAAESLNVDVSFILLPKLSSLGAVIGNSCSILLKPGFVQPPNIWSAIIGRSGARKSPALDTGCFGVMEYERGLMQQNRQAHEQYEEELAAWLSAKPKHRGLKPEPAPIRTCVMDDLTIEVLADILIANPRGVLTRKDELAHLFGSFDQYKGHHAKGSDVSRWLSLHTGVFLAVDRRTDKRHHRIWQPRVCITGSIQPTVLRRVLTEDFFERGLPARFLFACPPFRQDKWSESTIPDDLRNAVLKLFEKIWLLQPKHDDGGTPQPKLLGLDKDAKADYVAFYNECGQFAIEADEHGEAAYCKLTAYAARFALVGQLARKPDAEIVTADTMQAACDLARWCGNEAVRIYDTLAETQQQREQRRLIEFIESRNRTVSVRDVTHYYWPLKSQPEKAEQALNQLVKSGLGKWKEIRPVGCGRPTRKFQLLRTSPSPKVTNSRGETGNYGDGDEPRKQKTDSPGERDVGAVSDEVFLPTGKEPMIL